MKIGNETFYAGQPVLLIDSAKTTSVEGDSETTYLTGGRGNNRLLAWDGSKTLTLTVEDALFSAIGLSILMGADIAETNEEQKIHVRKGIRQEAKSIGTDSSAYVALDVSSIIKENQELCTSAPLYVIEIEKDNSLTGTYIKKLTYDKTKNEIKADSSASYEENEPQLTAGTTYYIDCYVTRPTSDITEIQVRKDKFPGYFYVEAETLYRRLDTGADMPATLTFPKVKIQSNFSISMSSEGDPSTATFTIDCFPGYTYFDSTKEVLCVMQIINDNDIVNDKIESVMLHKGTDEKVELRREKIDSTTKYYGFSDSDRTNSGESGWSYDDTTSTTTSGG